jgi:hypothetical protein
MSETTATNAANNDWHVARANQTYGPYAWQQLVEMAAAGNLAPTDMVWSDGMPDWLPASSLAGLPFAAAPLTPMPSAAAPITVNYYTPSRAAAPPSSDLDTVDWLMIVFCAGIACIVGFIRLIQGKPNAGKMIGFSLLSMVIWAIVRGVFMNMR